MPDKLKSRNDSERERVGAILAEKRKAERDIKRRVPADPVRRANCLADPFLFLATYFPDKFPNPWTFCQREMIDAINYRAQNGGDKAISGPRGCGKTTIVEGMVIYCIFRGLLKFALILAATGPDGSRILDNIKFAIETSDLLCADFPEVCDPIRALEGSPQRGNMQTYEGERTNIEWSRDRIVFPRVAGSACAACVIMARGIDGSIRGMNVFGLRPDFVLLDDIDTRESADSKHLTEKRERAIERDVAGLAGPGKKITKVMLCTPLNRTCNAYRYTDRSDKHSWDGVRYKLLDEWPLRRSEWEEKYIPARQSAQQAGDTEALAATKLYEQNKKEWDEGAKLSDESRFITGELSAVQHCFNIICDRGLDAFLTEYQSDPPVEAGPESSGINLALIVSRTNEFEHEVVPPDCSKLLIGIDVGMHRFHWVAPTWNGDAAGFVVDYDFADVRGTSPEDIDPKLAQDDPRRRMAIEQAIVKTLYNLRDMWIQNPYKQAGGEVVRPSLVPIDSGSGIHMNAVYQFCREAGKPFVPAKGFSPFYMGKPSGTRIHGDHCVKAWQADDKVWLYEFDSDYWKRWVHERFLTPTLDDDGRYRRGSISLWRPDIPHRHTKFARQIEAEVWVEHFVPMKGNKAGWAKKHKDNHDLDAMAMACMAASWCGVRVLGSATTKAAYGRTLAEMAAAAKS